MNPPAFGRRWRDGRLGALGAAAGYVRGVLGDGEDAELPFVPRNELIPGVRMTLSTEVLERIRGGHTTELRAYLGVGTERQSPHESAAIRVADARGVGNACGFDRRHVDLRTTLQNGRTVLALRDEMRLPDLLCKGAGTDLGRAAAGGGYCVHAFASLEFVVDRRRTPRRDRPRTRPRRGTEEEVVKHAPLQATPS